MEQGFGSLLDRRSAHPLSGATILQIVPVLGAGGAERTAIEIAAALAEAGARALVASEGGSLVSELQAKGGLWVPFPARSRNPVAMALNARRLARLIAAERVDLVHARSRPAAWVARGATQITKKPFVTTFVAGRYDEGATRRRYNSVMAQGDIVIAPSRHAAERVEALFPDAKGKIRIIHRGIDLQRFAPAAVAAERVQAVRRGWQVGADERVVLMANRLQPGRGHKVLIEAIRLFLTSDGTPVRVILAGEGEGRSFTVREIDAAISRAGLEAIVRRVGYCADMPAALLAAAVVVVPATRPGGLGRLVLEGQAMGTPIIGSDLGTLCELILASPEVAPARRTGWRVAPDDPAALADALREVMSLGASALDALAGRARAFVESGFSVPGMRAETLACYASLLAPQAQPVR
jgi:glycosyltransferase involved in cell wall biosynthesis